jgi:hypothetical protein
MPVLPLLLLFLLALAPNRALPGRTGLAQEVVIGNETISLKVTAAGSPVGGVMEYPRGTQQGSGFRKEPATPRQPEGGILLARADLGLNPEP